MTSSRSNIAEAQQSDMLRLKFNRHSIRISEAPVGELPLTYVGHSPMRHVTVHKSYVYIDQGVCVRSARRAERRVPTVLDHVKFAYWLGCVATARQCAMAA